MLKKSIVFAIVNYKNSEETQSLLNQLQRLQGIENVEVLVVDNTDRQAPLFEFKVHGFPTAVQILRTGKNLGYMGAGQYGFERLQAKDFEWFILANSDLELAKDFFEKLLSRKPSLCGLLGPAILSNLSRQDTNPYLLNRPTPEKMLQISRIFSRLWFSRIYQYLGLLKKLLKRIWSPVVKFSEGPVYAIHGAMMIFSNQYFKKGGDLRLPCFLFNEEIFAAETCRKLGLEVRYVPDLHVVHREHGSMGWNFSNQILGFKKEAAQVIYEKYFKDKN